eukprot:Nk52_evm112s352 gene=Nk52_evmTU112s352
MFQGIYDWMWPQASAADLLKEWKHKSRREGYALDRNIRQAESANEKALGHIRGIAKRGGDKQEMNVLVKEIVRSKKQISRLHTAKAQLKSLELQFQLQSAQIKVAECFQSSTEVMKVMNELISVKELSETMFEMSKEMFRAGFIEEQLEDSGMFGDELEDDELEEEAQAELDKILAEDTEKLLRKASNVPQQALPDEDAESEETQPEKNEEALLKRLRQLQA